MAVGVYKITEIFEEALCEYTGAPYCITVDSCSHAIFLSLYYEKKVRKKVECNYVYIPKKTFPSVPCEIMHIGATPCFSEGYDTFDGIYQLFPFCVWDCALRFTHNMYEAGKHMCISFTGPRKKLKLSKGGAILTDNEQAYKWFKSARMSGRHEKPFMEDNITFAGWNFYLDPEKSARGLMLLREFYTDEGEPVENEDVILEYPDLSKMEAFK